MTERRKLIEEASAKYFVGQEISPIRKPKATAWASIWLSKTKSSEFSLQRQCLQHRRRERAVAGVELGELDSQQDVLDGGQEPVGDVLVERHAALEGAGAQDPRAEDDVELARGDQPGHRADQLGGVLVVGVEHDDDVGAARRAPRA